jgi:hypothetical protein
MLERARRLWVVTVVGCSVAAPAFAQTAPASECPAGRVGCASTDVDFRWEHRAFQDLGFDTGFVPQNSPVQARFGVRIAGRTQVELGGRAETSWPEALDVAVPGRPQSGALSMAYGAEIIARLKVDTHILGRHIQWEGDLPFINLPSDLMLEKTTRFDPFAFEGAAVSASDSTERIRAFSYDVLGAIIPIPGLEGSLSLDVQGELEATYKTTRVAVGESGQITEHDGHVTLGAEDDAGFGAARDYNVLPEGRIAYRGGFRLFPVLTVEIFGITLIERDLGELPIHFDIASTEVKFKPATVHVPLPDVHVAPASLSAAPGTRATLTFNNTGEAPLHVRAIAWPTELVGSPPTFTVDTGATHTLTVNVAAGAQGAGATIQFATNDPDQPTLTVPFAILGAGTGTGGTTTTGTGTGTGSTGTGTGTGNGTNGGNDPASSGAQGTGQVSGCSAGGAGASSLAWLAVLAFVAIPRRKRGR